MKQAGSSNKARSHIGEIIFVTALVLIVGAIAIATSFWTRASAQIVSVSLRGKEVTTLRLDVPTTYEVYSSHGIVKIEVKDGAAAIVSSPCPNQSCVKEGYKSKQGSSIVCVPEEVVLRFLGQEEISEMTL